MDLAALGFRKINDRGALLEGWDCGGYLEGWDRLGIGIRPVEMQRAGLKERGLERLQFDFDRSYGDAPKDMSLLVDFPEAQAVRCSAHYHDSAQINTLSRLVSFRDHVFNREGLDWMQFADLQDLFLEDYHGKHHPDYSNFRDLRSLHTAYLPKKFAQLSDLPLAKIETLTIRSSPIQSFRGIESLKELRGFSLCNCRAFEAGELPGEVANLRFVQFYACPKVTSLAFVRQMPALEVLRLERVGVIESFEPLRGHPKLRRIEGPPLKGARLSMELRRSLPQLEFISPALEEG